MSNEDEGTLSPAWKALQDHQRAVKSLKIADLFKDDMARAQSFSAVHEGVSLDFSKNKITEHTLSLLCNLARERRLAEKREQLFGGYLVNTTEKRPALHMALRGSCAPLLEIGGKNVKQDVDASLARLKEFTQKIRAERKITQIVNIGIGGSDFGPFMVCKALRHLADPMIENFFISNIDPAHLAYYLDKIDPQKALFIVASKSFTTQETATNAASIKNWLEEKHGITDISQNFCAVTNNIAAAREFGIAENMVFSMPSWVGGRFSLWSALGLSIALSVGFENFEALLAGANSADTHFLNTPFERNIPLLMALIGIWYRNFWDYRSYGILPYSQTLSQLPQYIEQLDMESNGKSTDINGEKLPYQTAPVILGGVGSNAQHSFFQLLHQGSDIIPCDFIACKNPVYNIGDHHQKLLANVLGQTQALMNGQSNAQEPHRHFEGNRPSNILWLEKLTPYNLGMLLAFYEHKIFTQGAIWNINSFDQFGVELGKELAQKALKKMQGV
ncbi:MAG: glucose-6-phosphate isomerase [Alphaproteobacteria bacterium]